MHSSTLQRSTGSAISSRLMASGGAIYHRRDWGASGVGGAAETTTEETERAMTVSNDKKKKFLDDDLYDALRWLFEGAVAWQAASTLPERYRHQRVLGMYTSLVQARALYEFFYSCSKKADDARAIDFAPSWNESTSTLYTTYMASGKPSNKRVFHLVYDRSARSGGTGHDGPDHLKNQVLEFAKDLCRVTHVFAGCVKPEFRDNVQAALQKALSEAESAAQFYGIANPL